MTFFESSGTTSAYGSEEFSPQTWEKVRARGIRPEWCGPLDDTYELRAEFLAGARLLGLELVDLDDQAAVDELRARDPQFDPLQPQQLLIADALNAGTSTDAIEVPRRASKTTTILAWCLGRCASRSRYKITYSAQTGAAGVANLDEWARETLDRVNPPDDEDVPPWLRGQRRKPAAQQRAEALFGADAVPFDDPGRSGRGFRILRGNTKAGVYFDNLSSFVVVRPEAKAFRGKAGDVSWIDEAQEIDPTEGAALLAGILPLQDTRPDAKIIVSGTAGEVRAGPLWTTLEQLRSGAANVGGVDFAAPEDTPWSVIEDEDTAIALLKTVHPGVGTLTTEAKMRDRWQKLPRPEWAREYVSLWPETFGERAIPGEKWSDCTANRRPPKPTRVAFGLAIKPGGGTAAIAAAWRTERGLAYVEIIEHRQGTRWIPERAAELTRTYRNSTIAFDDIAEGKATHTESLAMTQRPRWRVQTFAETAAGCVQLLRDVERNTLRHFDDIGLNAAVTRTAKREVRNHRGVYLWSPTEPGQDITCLDAATRALRNWDQHFSRKTSRPRSRTAS